MFDLLPALRAGLFDSLAPQGITVVIVTLILLTLVRRAGIPSGRLGAHYAIALLTVWMVLQLSVPEVWYEYPAMVFFFKGFYWTLAVGSLIGGAAGLLFAVRDRPAGPPDGGGGGTEHPVAGNAPRWAPLKDFLGVVAAWTTGCAVAFCANVWPGDDQIVLIVYGFSLPGRTLLAVWTLMTYTAAFLWPVWVIFWANRKGLAGPGPGRPVLRAGVAAIFLVGGCRLLGALWGWPGSSGAG